VRANPGRGRGRGWPDRSSRAVTFHARGRGAPGAGSEVGWLRPLLLVPCGAGRRLPSSLAGRPGAGRAVARCGRRKRQGTQDVAAAVLAAAAF
jgi:hypothetical protein